MPADLLTTAAGLARTANDTSQPLSRREHARDSLRRWIDDHPRMFADAAERVRELEAELDLDEEPEAIEGTALATLQAVALEERRLKERVRQLEADNERLRFVVNGLSSGMIEPQAAECERLRAELAEAVEALVPFAAECDKRSWLADHEPAMRLFGIGGNAINNGHIMDAAAFVAKHKGNAS